MVSPLLDDYITLFPISYIFIYLRLKKQNQSRDSVSAFELKDLGNGTAFSWGFSPT